MIWIAANLLVMLVVKVEYNIGQRKHGIDVQHGKQILFVALEVGLVTFWRLGITWNAVATGFLESVLWTILFDIGYNLRWGNPIFYIGATSLYDRFWHGFKHPETTLLITKVVLLAGSMYLFIII